MVDKREIESANLDMLKDQEKKAPNDEILESLGCGRCETTCTNEAISITITDLSYVDKLIKDLEAHIEVS